MRIRFQPLVLQPTCAACLATAVILLASCDDDSAQPMCDRTLRVCKWNGATQAFDKDCKFQPACGDGGFPNRPEADAGTDVELLPAVWPANAVADNSVVDPVDVVAGTAGVGWDLCQSGSYERGPRLTASDPDAISGDAYLVWSGNDMQATRSEQTAQFFFYFSPTRLKDGGLWFSARRLAGTSASVRLELFETNLCHKRGLLGSYDLTSVLNSSRWTQACAPLPQGLTLSEIGVDVSTLATGQIALDGFKLGPACP